MRDLRRRYGPVASKTAALRAGLEARNLGAHAGNPGSRAACRGRRISVALGGADGASATVIRADHRRRRQHVVQRHRLEPHVGVPLDPAGRTPGRSAGSTPARTAPGTRLDGGGRGLLSGPASPARRARPGNAPAGSSPAPAAAGSRGRSGRQTWPTSSLPATGRGVEADQLALERGPASAP